MTASTQERLAATRPGLLLSLPVKAGAVILQGCVVVALAGVAIDGRAATTRAELSTMLVVGLATSSVTGGVVDGDMSVTVDPTAALLAIRRPATPSPRPTSASCASWPTTRPWPRPSAAAPARSPAR